MSIAYRYDSSLSMIWVTAIGEVSIEDRASFVEQIIHDPTMPETAPMLIDACRVTNAPQPADAARMTFLLRTLANRFQSRIAYWVTGVGLVTPFSLVSFAASLDSDAVRTFTSQDEAIDWLRST